MRKLPMLFAVLALPLAAAAQIGVSAGFTAARLNHPVSNVSSPTTLYGTTFGVYYQKGAVLALGGDIRANFLGGSGITLNSGAIGPRAAFRFRPLPLQLYGEALGGFNSYSGSASASSTNQAEYQLLTGFDTTLLPHIDWRVIEYAYTGASNSLSAHALSTGIVVRLP
ncbi:MAG TPA: hypothetical protein VNW54_02805 [Granulicella sp.]|jgi:hypothetical protein|nr:hypothetical protein [Granulicella sp.]